MAVSAKSSQDSLTSCLAELHLDTHFSNTSDQRFGDCTCSNRPCACFTAHQSLVSVLEKDLCAAAKVGKALWEDRMVMQDEMDELKHQLDRMNAENHGLLDHNDILIDELASLNRELRVGDARLEQLTRELDETKRLVSQFNTKNIHTYALEQQLQALDFVRENLQVELQDMSRDKREAEARWRKSERFLDKLTLQYEQLEHQVSMDSMFENRHDMPYSEARSRTEDYIKHVLHDKMALEATVAELEKQLDEYRKSDAISTKSSKIADSPISVVSSDIEMLSPPTSQPNSTNKVPGTPTRARMHNIQTPKENGLHSLDLNLPMTPESPLMRLELTKQESTKEETIKKETWNSETLETELRKSLSTELKTSSSTEFRPCAPFALSRPRTTAFSTISSTKDNINATSVALSSVDAFASVSSAAVSTSEPKSSIGLLSAVVSDKPVAKPIKETAAPTEPKKGWASSLLTRIKEGFERDDALNDPVSGFGFQV